MSSRACDPQAPAAQRLPWGRGRIRRGPCPGAGMEHALGGRKSRQACPRPPPRPLLTKSAPASAKASGSRQTRSAQSLRLSFRSSQVQSRGDFRSLGFLIHKMGDLQIMTCSLLVRLGESSLRAPTSLREPTRLEGARSLPESCLPGSAGLLLPPPRAALGLWEPKS